MFFLVNTFYFHFFWFNVRIYAEVLAFHFLALFFLLVGRTTSRLSSHSETLPFKGLIINLTYGTKVPRCTDRSCFFTGSCPSLSSSDFKAEDDDKENDTKKLKLKMGFVGLVEFALQCFDALAWYALL